MKAVSRILAALTVLALAAPAAMAQSQPYYGSSQVQNYPTTADMPVTTYVVPLNQNLCVDAEPRGLLKSPATILAELRAASDIPSGLAPVISVQRSRQLNAATNGRQIVITDSLLDRLDTNGERAFVIGHELAHVVMDHVGKTQTRRVGLSLLDQFLLRRYISEGTLADLATQLGLGLIDKKYSRNYEYQADELGMQLMVNAGYPACSALNVFETLQANTRASRMPEFLRDHPLNASRIQALVRKYQIVTGNRQLR